jgi:hypothetical protein
MLFLPPGSIGLVDLPPAGSPMDIDELARQM